MRRFFLDCSNGSRILVTTRSTNVASHLTNSNSHGMKFSLVMKFLDELSSWELFSRTVFGDGVSFPPEFEKIGKKIVQKCNGLPLSIVVIGGLMAKTQLAQQHWEHIGENLNSIVNSENDEYTGVFEEDRAIKVSRLVKLWVSEGFLKPVYNKSSETIAKEYLKELIDRNLIQVHELGALGSMKHCKVHDLLRDLSLKEAQKQRFYHVFRQHSRQGIDTQRRIVIPKSEKAELHDSSMEPILLQARSFVCHNPEPWELPDFRLLRTLHVYHEKGLLDFSEHFLENVFRLANSRYLAVGAHRGSRIPASVHLFWNLHTLIIYCLDTKPLDIWKMHQLKHVEFTCNELRLPDPPVSGDTGIVILKQLLVLKGVNNFNLNDEVVRRIPNVQKLDITYEEYLTERVNCLSHLQHLSKLESFHCVTQNGCGKYLQQVSFPRSLKKLSLNGLFYFDIEFEDILPKIGSLPHLQKLKLACVSFRTKAWETVEGQFRSLRFLGLYACYNLEKWTVLESCHFPLLEELHLHALGRLEEIPPEIGEIPTLKSIVLMTGGNESLVLSAKSILEEQVESQGDDLDLCVEVRCVSDKQVQALQYLATPNFRVRF